MLLNYLPDGFAGIRKSSVFKSTADWVDMKKPPGHTSQKVSATKTISDIMTLRHFFFSPNLVWFTIALATHLIVPYDIDAAKKGWNASWMLERLAVNVAVGIAYYGYFWVALYRMKWSQRKFKPGSFPTAGNMAHNVYYWFLGVVQWTWWEYVMTRLWATEKVAFATDRQILSDPYQIALNVLCVLLVPVWRDVHFYIAHRFIHVRAIYKYVHSLHHRNNDVEPFAGMCMHPVEHLYYFSNAFVPSLYLNVSPLVFLWCFMHLTLAPGASHSGFEDHFQADQVRERSQGTCPSYRITLTNVFSTSSQYHYLHHAKFECNYGSTFIKRHIVRIESVVLTANN